MANWLSLPELIDAFRKLGGQARWEQVRELVARNRDGSFKPYQDQRTYENTLWQVLHTYCPGYKKFSGNAVFQKIGVSEFRLIGVSGGYHAESDSEDDNESAVRRVRESSEYNRDPKLVQKIKAMYRWQCQICGCRTELPDGTLYAEAHHIRGLGDDGPDEIANMLCVCANCHVLLDLKAIVLQVGNLRHLDREHKISQDYVARHNELAAKRFGKRVGPDLSGRED